MGKVRLKVRTDLAKKAQGETTIYVAYTYKEKTKFFTTKQKINLDFWDANAEQVKKGHEKAKVINAIINGRKAEVQHLIDEAYFKKREPSFEYVQEQLDAIYNPKPVKVISTDFFVLADEFIKEITSIQEKDTVVQYRNTFRLLKDFQERKKYAITLESIDMSFHTQFVKFCEQVHTHSPNTIGKAIKNLKTFLKYLTDKGINANLTYQQRSFKKPSSKTDIIYLTKAELDQIAQTDLTSIRKLERVKDAFIFECITGLRYSDLANLKSHNIK